MRWFGGADLVVGIRSRGTGAGRRRECAARLRGVGDFGPAFGVGYLDAAVWGGFALGFALGLELGVSVGWARGWRVWHAIYMYIYKRIEIVALSGC